MLRNIFASPKMVYCGFLPFSIFDSDTVTRNTETARNALDEFKLKEQSGKERLFFMFSTDEFGNLSPELNSTLQVGFFGTFIGAVYGGINQSKAAYINFMENNQATTFLNHLDAKKKLQDHVTINFGKGAFKWGWRLGLFSTSYILITTSLSVYRGKTTIVEYLVGGGVTGALYKFTLGPRAILVGGLLGTCLGAVAGSVSLGLLKLAGISMEDVRYWQYQFHVERNEKFRKLIKEHKEKDDIELLKQYKIRTENEKHNLDSIDAEK